MTYEILADGVAVNGHVEARYVEGAGWQAPRIVRDPHIRIHGLSPSINYGKFV